MKLQLPESVFGELSRSFFELVNLSVNSELRSAKRVVNPNYDDAKPCIDNFHNRLRDEWGKCLTQANGLATLTYKETAPSPALMSFRYSQSPHHKFQKQVLLLQF
ncbi:hypothetical protein GJ496_002160 [Pomphorhynchus laevis]|nr:hypothetical protein GJ496_002160 [Pomphorhynchus laevis]